jgi:hypothetical protein
MEEEGNGSESGSWVEILEIFIWCYNFDRYLFYFMEENKSNAFFGWIKYDLGIIGGRDSML